MDFLRSDAPVRRRRRRIAFAGGAVAFAGAVLSAALWLGPSAPGVDRRTVQIDAVVEGELVREVRGTGTLVPREQRRVVALASGRVEGEPLKPGVEVTEATVLFTLVNPDAEEAAAAARAQYEGAAADLAALRGKLQQDVADQRARVAEARGAHELARLESRVDAQLLEQGAASGLQAARSKVAADERAARLRSEEERLGMLQGAIAAQLQAEEARLAGLRKTWERRQQGVEELRVRAGLGGVLQSVNAEPGQSIAAGAEVARVARLGAPGALKAELRISELDARDLAVGQRATIDTHDGTIEGRVERVDPAVRDGAVKVDVELTGAIPAGARADLGVEGVIELERLAKVRHVARPATARAESRARLFVVRGGQAVRVPVRLGKASVDRIVVLEGLAPGDQVIVSDMTDHAGHDRLEVR
jgi:HlyD family secretion protein